MNNTPIPYTFNDALHRVRMNIMNYQDCFDESTEQFKQNEKLLAIIDAACDPTLQNRIRKVLDTVAYSVCADWSDLGWDIDGCPDDKDDAMSFITHSLTLKRMPGKS